jgi:hypothetical protein
MKSIWMNTLAWVAAVVAALVFAFAAPNESSVMGRMPSPLTAQRLGNQPVALPAGLPAERTLALITFKRGQGKEVDSWIQGLQLQQDRSIPWVRMPVLNDPGNPAGRGALENHLLSHFRTDGERANLVPVFTDQDAFIRSAGLGGSEQAYAVVISREGEVLARVAGQFDQDKAHTLLETLKQQAF